MVVELNLQEVHILRAVCFETDTTVIQLLLFRDKMEDQYVFAKLIGGKYNEWAVNLTYEQAEKKYNEAAGFYKGHRQPIL